MLFKLCKFEANQTAEKLVDKLHILRVVVPAWLFGVRTGPAFLVEIVVVQVDAVPGFDAAQVELLEADRARHLVHSQFSVDLLLDHDCELVVHLARVYLLFADFAHRHECHREA